MIIEITRWARFKLVDQYFLRVELFRTLLYGVDLLAKVKIGSSLKLTTLNMEVIISFSELS